MRKDYSDTSLFLYNFIDQESKDAGKLRLLKLEHELNQEAEKLVRQSRFLEAAAVYQKLYEETRDMLDKSPPEPKVNQAQCYFCQGMLSEAIECYTVAESVAEGASSQLRYTISAGKSQCLLRVKRTREALLEATRGLELAAVTGSAASLSEAEFLLGQVKCASSDSRKAGLELITQSIERAR